VPTWPPLLHGAYRSLLFARPPARAFIQLSVRPRRHVDRHAEPEKRHADRNADVTKWKIGRTGGPDLTEPVTR
jgi:hypothetical protein